MSEGKETAMRGCRFELVKTVNIFLESSEDTVPLEKGARQGQSLIQEVSRRVR